MRVLSGLFALLLTLALALPVSAGLPTAAELLAAMDKNLKYSSRTSTMTMEVVDGRTTRSYKMVSYGRGESESAIEYLAPEREKGTRMLKQGGNMWIYMPRAERVQKISGHMLRQGMMGSGISYEDMLDQANFQKQYEAVVEGEEPLDGRACYKMVATARDPSVTYPKRVMWIDKETMMPLKQELYALSGMLLKTWTMSDIRPVGGQQVAFRMEITDQLKAGSKTVIVLEEVKFGVAIEEEIFSMRWLERK